MKLKPLSILPKIKRLTYDCEIIWPVRCDADWRNWEYLGLSVFGCHANWLPDDQQWQAFTVDDHFAGVQPLIDQAEEVIGFNSLEFDDQLCAAHGIRIQTTFDLMQEVRRAAGQPIIGRCSPGYNLRRLAEVNLSMHPHQVQQKSVASPGQVPDLWRAGEKDRVIKHCLNNVFLTKELFERRCNLIDPREPDRRLHCDPESPDWREMRSTFAYYFAERVASFQARKTYHWTGGTVLEARLSFAETIRLNFPIWLYPDKPWCNYVGLPFDRKKPQPPAVSDRESELNLIYNPEYDPIPF